MNGLSYVVGDVTRLRSARLGTFDFFLDIGCFQGLDARQRLAQGEGTYALANSGATLLMLSFGPSRWRWLVEGASQEEVENAFAGWEMLTSEPADTAGPGLADEQDRAAVVPAAPALMRWRVFGLLCRAEHDGTGSEGRDWRWSRSTRRDRT